MRSDWLECLKKYFVDSGVLEIIIQVTRVELLSKNKYKPSGVIPILEAFKSRICI